MTQSDASVKFSCETQGHLWGSNNSCIMCNAPQPAELRTESKLLLCGEALATANERIAALEAQDVVHWKTRRGLLAELAQTRSDRQREHDLRVKFSGDCEQLRAELALRCPQSDAFSESTKDG